MPFLGKQPTAGFASIVKDDLTADGSTTAFTLSKQVANANDIAVFLGNVRQEPTDAYTVSGTTLTMSAAPASGLNFYVLHIAGTVESSVVPADNTISTAKIQNDAITGAKIENNPTIAGNLTVSGTSTLTGNTTASGTFTSTGLITASAGMAVGGTGVANTLDDYETGTFDCSITQGGGTNSTQTALGYYEKVGQFVMVHGQTTINSVGSGGGILRITLPFAGVSGYRGALTVGINQACALPTGAANGYLNIIVELGSTAAYIVGTAPAGGHNHLGIGNLGTGLFSFGGCYKAL